MYENLNDNEFVDIPGYEGYYQINKLSEIISCDRHLIHRSGKHFIRRGILRKQVTDRDGYLRVNLSVNGKTKMVGVHRLMAVTFINNAYNKPHINHINGIKKDNSIMNLEWCTIKENNRHAFDTGLNKNKSGKDHYLYGKRGPNAGKFGEQLKQTKIFLDTNTGIFYFGGKEAAFAKNIKLSTLRGMMVGNIKNITGLIYV